MKPTIIQAMGKTVVISAFPGCGKSYCYDNSKYESLILSDSDSSKFSWKVIPQIGRPDIKIRNKEFPKNYIVHIKSLLATREYDYIFVSSHEEVRRALDKYEIPFLMVYPKRTLKEEWIERYKQRGSSPEFIQTIEDHWDDWMDGLDRDAENHPTILLQEGEYLSDVIDVLEGRGSH